MSVVQKGRVQVHRSRRFRSLLHALVVLSLLVLAPGSGMPHPAEAQGSGNIAYAYDALGRLIAVTDLNAATNGTAVYSYDAVGNLTGITRQSATQLALFEFAPHQGAIGTTVTLSGTGFSTTPGSNIVRFNGTAATVTAATTTQLTVTVPSGATSGTISVQVGANTVTSSASFTVGSTAPTITSISPTLGTPATYASGAWTAGVRVEYPAHR
jgi:YD repeat-containing protein